MSKRYLFIVFCCLFFYTPTIGLYAQCLQVNVEVIVDQWANPCNGPITLDAHYPGYNHLWSTGATTKQIVVTKTDTYIVTVDDGLGCVGTDTIKVTFLDKPSVSLGPDPASQCGGCITLNPALSPGLDYLWSTGETTDKIKYCKPGKTQVSLTVKNSLGCIASDTVEVTITPGLNVSLGPDISTCDDMVTLTSNLSGVSNLWSTGESTSSIVVTQTGKYYLEVSDGTCGGIDTVDVTILDKPTVSLGSNPPDRCGGCIQLNAGNTPGLSYLWSNGSKSNSTTICSPGIHEVIVRVTNELGCTDADTVNFEIKPGIKVALGPDINTCNLNVVLDSKLSGYDFLWNTGATTRDLNVNQSGVYSLFVTDGNCTGVDTVAVNFLPHPSVDLGADPDPKCGGCVALSVTKSPGIDYIWSTGETASNIKYCKEGTNDVKIVAINSDGCIDSDTIKVSILSGYNFHLNNGKDTAVCKGPVVLEAQEFPGATYLWSTGATNSSIEVNSAGSYYVDIFNLPGCNAKDTLTDTIAVSYKSNLPAPANITDQSDCSIKKYSVSPVEGATSYTWTVPQGVSILNGQGTQTITVSANGTVTGTIGVEANNLSPSCKSDKQELDIMIGEPVLNIPNAFSPNNDGINDVWVIRNIQFYPDNELIVLNRWGNEVYRVKNYNSNWDGSSLNQGSYFYKLVLNECKEKKEFTGYITIVR